MGPPGDWQIGVFPRELDYFPGWIRGQSVHACRMPGASKTVGTNFYRKLNATVADQSGDTVTLQLDPATLL